MVLGEAVRNFASAGTNSTAATSLHLQDGASPDPITTMEQRAEKGRQKTEAVEQEVDLELARPPYLHVCQSRLSLLEEC